MRIVGGSRKGLNLTEVGRGDATARLRPTSDRVRESLFNLLMNGGYADRVTDARVLDLFAGTGALGLEALSRGAAEAVLVDNGKAAAKLIVQNIAKTRFEPNATHLRRDARRLGTNPGKPFDLVFLDPPYGKGLTETVLGTLHGAGWLAPHALVVAEDNAPLAPPVGFELLDTRRFGGTVISLLQLQ